VCSDGGASRSGGDRSVTGLLAKLLSGQIRPSGTHRSAAPEPILTSPEQLSCHGLDNPDVEVVDEQDDSGSGELNVGALERRPSTPQGDLAARVDAFAANAQVGPTRGPGAPSSVEARSVDCSRSSASCCQRTMTNSPPEQVRTPSERVSLGRHSDFSVKESFFATTSQRRSEFNDAPRCEHPARPNAPSDPASPTGLSLTAGGVGQ
jgi:hypothetical protein